MPMKKNSESENELRSEYDLKSLSVRRLGFERKGFGGTVVRLDPDVAEFFSSAEAVNEALRFLVRATQEKQSSAPTLPSEGSVGGA